jgi:hypothetical protein
MYDLGLIQRSGKTINACLDLQNISPHELTVRYSYTIDPGSAGFFYIIRANIYRTQAATTVGTAQIIVQISFDGSTYYYAYNIALTNNTVGSASIAYPLIWIPLKSGEIVRVITIDNSVGGTCSYVLTMLGYLIR